MLHGTRGINTPDSLQLIAVMGYAVMLGPRFPPAIRLGGLAFAQRGWTDKAKLDLRLERKESSGLFVSWVCNLAVSGLMK
jgi:hypothetical protein